MRYDTGTERILACGPEDARPPGAGLEEVSLMAQEKRFSFLSWRVAAMAWVAVGLGVIIWLLAAAPGDRDAVGPNRDFDSDEAYVMLYERLLGMARSAEAKEYVSLLFPLPATEAAVFEPDEDLDAWNVTIAAWPAGAREGFESAAWFGGDFEAHISTLGEPVWIVYPYGRVLPTGGALLVEANIARLNEDRRLD
jgi:hypothetical protein